MHDIQWDKIQIKPHWCLNLLGCCHFTNRPMDKVKTQHLLFLGIINNDIWNIPIPNIEIGDKLKLKKTQSLKLKLFYK